MHSIWKLTCQCLSCSLLILFSAASVTAQVTSVQPQTVSPGATTELIIRGQGLQSGVRVQSTLPASTTFTVEPIDDASAKLLLTLPPNCPLGPAGLWIGSAAGPSSPLLIVVDDLPATTSIAGNHSLETAQSVPALTVIEGNCDAGKSDFYKFTLQQSQRIAVQTLVQSINSAMDPVVILRDATGKVVRRANEGQVSPDSIFAFTAEEAGDYFLEILDSRYAGGHPYRLRIGDFPTALGVHPLAIYDNGTNDNGTEQAEPSIKSIELLGTDRDAEVTISMALPSTADLRTTEYQSVAAKFADGQSSQSFRVLKPTVPVITESIEASGTSITAPMMISGILQQSGEVDSFNIQASPGQTLRFSAITRQLDRPTLLHMSLHNPAGAQVAETPVNHLDQWSFDVAIPEAGIYQLKVRDLLMRGGPEFGYVVSISAAPSFHVTFRAEATTRRHFSLEAANAQQFQAGAIALPLQVARFGYDGPIELAFATPVETLEIINPLIPAGINELLIYIRATSAWTNDSIALPTLIASSPADDSMRSVVSSLELNRVLSPHNPFPYLWDTGKVAMAGVTATDAWYTLATAQPLQFAKHHTQHTLSLTIQRQLEAFKAPVTLLPSKLPAGWSMEPKLEGDAFTVTLKTSPVSSDQQSLPEQITLVAYAEHEGRGRVNEFSFPIEWYEAVEPQLKGPKTLVAGTAATFNVKLNRKGTDNQPLTLTLVDLPPGIVPATNPISVPGDASEANFLLSLTSDLQLYKQLMVNVVAEFSTADSVYKIRRPSEALLAIPLPHSITTYPDSIQLTGRRERQRMVVTGHSDGGNRRDWTRDAVLQSADESIAQVRDGVIHPVADGATELLVKVGPLEKRIPLRVEGSQQSKPIAFENEVLVALSKQGCNSGACHGSPSGKGGFRLSLRAFDKKLDELTLLREDFGRRLNVVEPTKSLLLEKPLMKVGHGGGKQIRESDEAYGILRDWIAEGAAMDTPDSPKCIQLEVYPGEKTVLDLSSGIQQIAATAHYSNGTKRDVTHLVAYESTNNLVATVDADGRVTAHARGEAVILVRYLEHIRSVPLMFVDSIDGFQWQTTEPNNYIDRLVYDKLAKLQYLPSPTCTDGEFIRRAYLDVIGILPSVAETQAFLHDQAEDKRARLIDSLLERDEYAKFWALKWGDLLKTTSKMLGDDGVYKYHRWVENAFHDNMPYDQFAQALLTASGSTLSNPPANFYRAAKDMHDSVENISQLFLGARLQCAKCHNHPFEHWTQDNYFGLGAFFQRVQRRNTQRPGEMFIWYTDAGEVTQPRTGATMKPWLPEKGSVEEPIAGDRRRVFAEWLISPENPYFAKIEANRIWSQLFARGIVEPIDDFRDSNPPANESLLEALAQDFIASGYDRKHLLRTILNSRTYQASYQTVAMNEGESLYFSHQVPRLLSAEQLFDAINHVTGTTHTFGHLPADMLATHLPAPDIAKVEFLKTFGQPERTTVCECEREDESNLGMAIELFNGSLLHEKLTKPDNRFRLSLAAGQPLVNVIKELYLAALCREPTAEELASAVNHCDKSESPDKGLEDICWALLNRDEFLFQH